MTARIQFTSLVSTILVVGSLPINNGCRNFSAGSIYEITTGNELVHMLDVTGIDETGVSKSNLDACGSWELQPGRPRRLLGPFAVGITPTEEFEGTFELDVEFPNGAVEHASLAKMEAVEVVPDGAGEWRLRRSRTSQFDFDIDDDSDIDDDATEFTPHGIKIQHLVGVSESNSPQR